mmetsp:Transcript_1111/g.2371  ORF Transcript_1111/g.2371 Transcript_1111/m.2371 type:complete len:101 (-) Transcript_1111:367-669(-)
MSHWDRHVALLVGQDQVLSGGAIIPIQPAAAARKSAIHAQKGISLRAPEAAALVDAVMDGKVHRDWVYIGGQQCAPPSVLEVLLEPSSCDSPNHKSHIQI